MQTSLIVNDMNCKHCVMTIRKAVEAMDGVEKIDIDLDRKAIDVIHQDKINADDIINTIKTEGYDEIEMVG